MEDRPWNPAVAELVRDVADAVGLGMLPRGALEGHFRLDWPEADARRLARLVRREFCNRSIERARGE